ncbi:MAG: hypothetical protein JSS02_27490 [Planctomycetes bacterium]|nr:hypothetical protein [Planctomycetota bacterium]
MEEARVELSIGESIQLNQQILTVVDIQGDEIIFRIDHVDDGDLHDPFGDSDWLRRNPR